MMTKDLRMIMINSDNILLLSRFLHPHPEHFAQLKAQHSSLPEEVQDKMKPVFDMLESGILNITLAGPGNYTGFLVMSRTECEIMIEECQKALMNPKLGDIK